MFIMSGIVSLFAWGRLYQGLDTERFSDKCERRREILMCLAALFDDLRIKIALERMRNDDF